MRVRPAPRKSGNNRTKLRVLFENGAGKPPVFQMTEARVAAAARRHKDVRVEVAVETDFNGGGKLEAIDALVTSSDIILDPRFPRATLGAAAPALRFIHVIGAGVERLMPLDWLPQGMQLTNNSGVHVAKMREFVAMALLLLNTRMPEMVGSQFRREWNPIFTPSIAGKTAGIIGVGDLGGAAARVAQQLGLRVIGMRRTPRPHRHVDLMLPTRRLDELLKRSDFVVIAAPLTVETRGLIGGRELDLMKPTASLLNIGRAAIVDYEALCDRLDSGRLAGAILDVFDPEPLPSSSRLWTTRNLIISPHCSSDDDDRYMDLTLDLVFDNLRRLAAGKQPRNIVRPDRQY
jgi:phosphoglycerate dehydrogenase-like enzyme